MEIEGLPNILVITTRPLYPLHGGDRVRLNTIIDLSKSIGKTTILFNTLWYENMETTKSVLAHKQIKFIHKIISPIQFIFNLIKLPFSNEPIQNLVYSNSKVDKDELKKYDYIICHLSRSEILVRNLNTNILLDLTDNLLIHYNRVKFDYTIKSIIFMLERNRLSHYYSKIASKRVCSVISERDKIHSNNFVLRNSINFCSNLYDKSSKNILFVGNIKTYPNRQALKAFINSNSNFLINHGFTLYVIGKGAKKYLNSSNFVKSIENYDRIDSLGVNFCVGIAPMLSGAGLQNKILDYLTHCLPVVSTPLSLDAFIPNEKLFYLEEDISKYGAIIKNLKPNEKIDKEVKEYLKKHFSYESIRKAFLRGFINANRDR